MTEPFDAVLAEIRRCAVGWFAIPALANTMGKLADRLQSAHAAEIAELREEADRRTREVELTYPVQRRLTDRAEAAERDARQAMVLLRELRATGFGLNDHWRERIDAALAAAEAAHD